MSSMLSALRSTVRQLDASIDASMHTVDAPLNDADLADIVAASAPDTFPPPAAATDPIASTRSSTTSNGNDGANRSNTDAPATLPSAGHPDVAPSASNSSSAASFNSTTASNSVSNATASGRSVALLESKLAAGQIDLLFD